MDGHITMREAVIIAASYPKAPKTYAGLLYAGLRFGFITQEEIEDLTNTKVWVDLEKLNDYLEYRENYYSLPELAELYNSTITTIQVDLGRLGLKGVRKYGKTFIEETEYKQLKDYYRHKRNN